jgi:hypothetical protein
MKVSFFLVVAAGEGPPRAVGEGTPAGSLGEGAPARRRRRR